MLALFNQGGSAKKNSALAAVRKAFPGLSRHKAFSQATLVMHSILKHLKQQGLNQITYDICKTQACSLPEKCALRKRILNWLDHHQQLQTKLGGQHSLLVSTDILESLFGKFKRIIERSPIADINRMALVIPALCGNAVNEKNISELFATTHHKDIAEWERNNITHTIRKKRQMFFKSKK